ncbi:hypothetical protein [Streptomyces sp.]|uniref:hypothetical protein n=1 Tax=Streptomyces sp. TaxID=1931 RepID=UPI0039C986A7
MPGIGGGIAAASCKKSRRAAPSPAGHLAAYAGLTPVTRHPGGTSPRPVSPGCPRARRSDRSSECSPCQAGRFRGVFVGHSAWTCVKAGAPAGAARTSWQRGEVRRGRRGADGCGGQGSA